ncbi:hypothetical protein UE233_11630 [Acinetobacter oleivorans]|uniref:hypothetical protein n=1 Tax=Acinetobacter oleivorans TaxID=1148157 RepID=UPI002AAE65C1|nr:hypothetical protein [Acinetobacter oleivorans]MDY7373282.1 hypothetical protein [Acinetobacter oleivorans]
MPLDKINDLQNRVKEIIQITNDMEAKKEYLDLQKGSDPYETTYTLHDLRGHLKVDSFSTPFYLELYTDEDFELQANTLKDLKAKLVAIKNNIFQNQKTPVNFGDFIRDTLKFSLYYFNINLTDEKNNKEYLLKIYDHIKSTNSTFDSIGTIKNYLDTNEYDETILLKFFDFFKKNINGTKEEKDKIERDIIDLLYDKKTQQLNGEVEKLTELSKGVREKIGLIEDQKLIFAHQNFSNEQDGSICKLSWAINAIFIFIIGSLATLFYHYTESKIEFNWRNYVFYLSIYITLTGYLTYLIKERVRLLNIKTYCDKTWLEITALSSYMAEFKPEEVVKLKMQLADKYFAGPNIESSNIKELSPELTTSLIMELLKSGKDQASK